MQQATDFHSENASICGFKKEKSMVLEASSEHCETLRRFVDSSTSDLKWMGHIWFAVVMECVE